MTKYSYPLSSDAIADSLLSAETIKAFSGMATMSQDARLKAAVAEILAMVAGDTGAASFLAVDGTGALPAYAFATEPSLGFDRSAAGVLAFCAGGFEAIVFRAGSMAPTSAAKDLGRTNAGNQWRNLFVDRVVLTTQAPTEAVLVSGVDATAGSYIVPVALTAARVVGAPLNPPSVAGQRIVFTIVQGGAGGFAVTWNAVFKVSWSDTGNTVGKRSTIAFIWDGTNWNQDGAQTPYI
jgi:hypothetical protein